MLVDGIASAGRVPLGRVPTDRILPALGMGQVVREREDATAPTGSALGVVSSLQDRMAPAMIGVPMGAPATLMMAQQILSWSVILGGADTG